MFFRGKVFLFTGMLPVCQDEDGVAAVLAHEIAHNVAHHISEQVSRNIILSLFGVIASFVFDVGQSIPSLFLSVAFDNPASQAQEVCSINHASSNFSIDFKL